VILAQILASILAFWLVWRRVMVRRTGRTVTGSALRRPPPRWLILACMTLTVVTPQTAVASGRAPTTTTVTCDPSSVGPGASTTCTATVTTSGASVQPSGSVIFTRSGGGGFLVNGQTTSSGTCSLPSFGPAFCQGIYYAGSTPETVKIAVSYQGDSTYAPSSNFTDVKVATAPSPSPAFQKRTASGLTIYVLAVPYRQLPAPACQSFAASDCADIMEVDVYLGFGYTGSGTVNLTDAPGPGLAIDDQWQLVDKETGGVYPIQSEGNITGACAGGDQSSLSNVYVIVGFKCFGRMVESGHCYVPGDPVVWFIQASQKQDPLTLRFTDFDGKQYDIDLGTMSAQSQAAPAVGVGSCGPPSATSGGTVGSFSNGTNSSGGSSSSSTVTMTPCALGGVGLTVASLLLLFVPGGQIVTLIGAGLTLTGAALTYCSLKGG